MDCEAGAWAGCAVRGEVTDWTAEAEGIFGFLTVDGRSDVGAGRTTLCEAAGGDGVTTLANEGNGGRGFVDVPEVTAGAETRTGAAAGAGGTFHFSANRDGTTRSFRALVAAT